MDEIPVITAYTKDGNDITEFDPTEDLEVFSPVVEMLPGWNADISECRKYDELPENAKAYVERLEELIGHKIHLISVGAERNQFIIKENWL